MDGKKSFYLLLSIGLILILSLGAILSACAVPAPAPAPAPTPTPTPAPAPTPSTKPSIETINLRYSMMFPEPSSNFKMILKPMLDEIKQKSGERITFTIFGGGSLGAAKDQYDVVSSRKADLGWTFPSYTPGRFPLTDILSFPGTYEPTDAGQRVSLGIWQRILEKDYPDTHVINIHQGQIFYLYTNSKLVKNLEDLNGLKIRSGGGLMTPVLSALGATPVTMPIEDLYLSLQTGVVSGATVGPSGILTYKQQEVLKYVTKFKFGYPVGVVIMNLDTWTKIPDDLKQIITEAGKKVGFNQPKMMNQDEPLVIKALIDRGGETYTLPKDEEARWSKFIKPVIDKWVSDLDAKGLPGQELMKVAREECQKENISFPY